MLDEQAAGVQSTLSALKAQGLGGEVYTRDEAIRKYMELSEGVYVCVWLRRNGMEEIRCAVVHINFALINI